MRPEFNYCRQCMQIKPFTKDYFPRCIGTEHGLLKVCSECSKAARADYLKKNTIRIQRRAFSYLQRNKAALVRQVAKQVAKQETKTNGA